MSPMEHHGHYVDWGSDWGSDAGGSAGKLCREIAESAHEKRRVNENKINPYGGNSSLNNK